MGDEQPEAASSGPRAATASVDEPQAECGSRACEQPALEHEQGDDRARPCADGAQDRHLAPPRARGDVERDEHAREAHEHHEAGDDTQPDFGVADRLPQLPERDARDHRRQRLVAASVFISRCSSSVLEARCACRRRTVIALARRRPRLASSRPVASARHRRRRARHRAADAPGMRWRRAPGIAGGCARRGRRAPAVPRASPRCRRA